MADFTQRKNFTHVSAIKTTFQTGRYSTFQLQVYTFY
jgi:hypothetical protein